MRADVHAGNRMIDLSSLCGTFAQRWSCLSVDLKLKGRHIHCMIITLRNKDCRFNSFQCLQWRGGYRCYDPLWCKRATSQITKFMGPTWDPPGSCRPQMGPCWPHWPCYQGCSHQSVAGWFPPQRASDAESVSVSWLHPGQSPGHDVNSFVPISIHTISVSNQSTLTYINE